MGEVRLTPLAIKNLEDIWLQIAAHNERAADDLLTKLWDQFDLAADFPNIGSPRPEVAPGVRILVQGRYIAIYKPAEDGILIAAVVHGAMDPVTWLA